MTVLVNCNGHPCSLDGNSCHCQFCMIFGRGGINFSDYFEFNTLCTRSHSLTLKVLSSTIDAFCYCFFVSMAFLWNTIPEDILARSVEDC